jgi:hypothetical protein
MKFIQHVSIEPDWPEHGFRADGSQIRLAEVEATLPPGDERAGVYFLLKDGRTKCWPWKESGYYVDEAGDVLAPTGPLPMPRAELEGLGLNDDTLSQEHAAYFATGERLDPHAQDTFALQQLRRRMYNETSSAWYGDAKRLHGR